MKKNIVIVLLIVVSVMLFAAYNNASNERNELKEALKYETVNHDILKRQIKETGLYLYDVIDDGEYVENLLWRGSRSICGDAYCVDIDYNGDITVMEFYHE